MTAVYGTGKTHIGVKLADGTYDTSSPPDLTGAEFQIVETGPNAPTPNTTTCTLAPKPIGESQYPGDEDYAYYCDFDPSDTHEYWTYFIQDDDQISMSQLTAAPGTRIDPDTKEPPVCVDPPEFTGLCQGFGGVVHFEDAGIKPKAANYAVVNHGKAQTIDVLDKSKTAGLTPSITISQQAAGGKAVVNGAKIVYTPKSTFGGADSFKYNLHTSTGDSVGTVQVSVEVPPTAKDDAAKTKGAKKTKGKKVTINVLGNDLARGGGTLHGLAVKTKPKHGTTKVTSGKIAYTPDKGFHGTDTLTYLVKNKYGDDTAKVTVTVAKP